ncbi:hypothetical protein [Polaromonas sp.]|uniref:hypothetical protein n=1 Tax=Polaromonas sp. TaxID=1869339 RepID=UPI003753288D
MNQLSLSLPETRARRLDPQTSKAAATASVEFSAGHKARILAALKQHGPRSAHELSLLIGLTIVQVDRRTVELQRAGSIRVLVIDGAEVVRHGCRVWEAVA